MPKCTVIIIQPGDVESNHIRMTDIPFDPNSTSHQFKSEIHKLLKTPQYKNNLINDISYYSHIGIINECISPHDIFQIYDKDILMDCISPNDTLYIYNPSINTDTVLIHEIITFFTQLNNAQYNDYDDIQTTDIKQSEASQSYRNMSISQSYASVSEDIDIINTLPSINSNDKKKTFFNAINLYFAYCGAKYGTNSPETTTPQLVQISHSILIWALRKMDKLWTRKDVQDKLREYLNAYSFEEEVIIDTIIFGNKLTNENAIHLITYTPWMTCEPTLSMETYHQLQQHQHHKGNSLSSEQASAPIINEQQAILNSNHIDDSMDNNSNNSVAAPVAHKEKYVPKNESLDGAFLEIKRNKETIENGPRRWPAREGMFLYFCQFVFGLCDNDKFYEYMSNFGKCIGLSKEIIKYMLLLWESEKDLAKSLWNFAELEFPLSY